MKLFKQLLFLITVLVFFPGCQRELGFVLSTGVLKKDLAANCLPVTINGTYKVDTTFTNKNFIDVQVDVIYPGSFDIQSDTINGYSFYQSGKVDKGTSTIRLIGSGKPVKTGINHFTVSYGESTCTFSIKVTGLEPAVYTLAGSPNTCTDLFADGTYRKGIPLNASNILLVKVNVTVPGRWEMKTATINGFSFSGNGIFTATGLQTVVLKGTGTPLKEEVSNVIISNIVSTCRFGINVVSDSEGKAIFSFDGSPFDCLHITVNGSYYAGIDMDVANTITMTVNVTKLGTYSINTNTANGITFSNAGTFTKTGEQTVTLTAKGSAVSAESTAFVPNTGTVSCNFLLNVAPLPPLAAFTLSGAPGACTSVTVNGFYIVSKPLDAANTVIIQVNVSTPGSYKFSTSTVNGISFSASGILTASGLQNVTMHGNGTPLALVPTVVTPGYFTSSCSFTVPIQ